MVSQLRILSDDIARHYELKSVFLLAYDLDKESEIQKKDTYTIKKILSKCKNKKGLVILEGVGGDPRAGQEVANLLRRQFNTHMVSAVPKIAGSALVYPIFYSSCILADDVTRISPIDPSVYYKGKMVKCIIGVRHVDEKLRKMSIKCLDNVLNLLDKYFATKGCIIGRDLSLNEKARFVKTMIWTNSHEPNIDKEKMKCASFNVAEVEEGELAWVGIKKLTSDIRTYIANNKIRGCVFLDGKINDLK